MTDCIFCKIEKGEIPSYKIYEDDKVYAFLDIACDAVGHTLVIPKKHCTNVLDCDREYLDAVIEAVNTLLNSGDKTPAADTSACLLFLN